MRYALTFALVGLCTAMPALATPVSMTCTLIDSGGPSVFDVQVNEDTSSVSYFIRRNGMSVRRPAIITPDMVSYSGFTISRKTLAFVRSDDGAAGACVINKDKRAF